MSNKDDSYKVINKIPNLIALQTFAELQNQITQMYSPITNITSEIQDQYNAIATAAVPKVVEQISNGFLSPFIEALLSENYQQKILAIQNSLDFLASTIASINVQSTYVSVPESLIPDDFFYEEVSDDSADTSDKTADAAVAVKRLSFDKALEFLKAAITVMQAIKLFTELSPSAIQMANKAIESLISIYQAIEDRLP